MVSRNLPFSAQTPAWPLRDPRQILQVLDSIEDGLLVIDREKRVLFANQAVCARRESPGDIHQEFHCYELRCSSRSPCAHCDDCLADRVFETGQTLRTLFVCPYDGDEKRYFEVYASPILGPRDTVVAVAQVIRDVTEQYETQAHLEDTENFAILGRIAAEIVHEINSSMAAIATCAEGLLRAFNNPHYKDLRQLDYFPKYLETMERAAYRCKAAIEDTLKLVVHQERPNWDWVDIHDVLKESLSLIQYEAKREHKVIETKWAEGIRLIRADALQLARAFLNLIHNALDAIEDKEQGQVQISTRATADGVQVIIHDTGCGILPEHRSRIFEPFFTTKPSDKGMGLGLTVAQRIFELHKARLMLESEPGIGTTVIVELPRDPKAVE